MVLSAVWYTLHKYIISWNSHMLVSTFVGNFYFKTYLSKTIKLGQLGFSLKFDSKV
jgi:hypothetical protein